MSSEIELTEGFHQPHPNLGQAQEEMGQTGLASQALLYGSWGQMQKGRQIVQARKVLKEFKFFCFGPIVQAKPNL